MAVDKEQRQSMSYLGDTYDVYCQEQPVNYSLKYPEETNEASLQRNRASHTELNKATRMYTTEETDHQFMYNSYATTDMDNFDQPIDYSRKYHEYGIDECNQQLGFNNLPCTNLLPKDASKLSCSYEDTIKIFCTEDTPLNFSSASSWTDLRGVGLSGLQTPNSCLVESLEKNLEIICSLKDNSINEDENEFLLKENKELSSPVLIIQPSNQQVSKVYDEASVDQTPLMFSRSSSLCSLNSFEQPLIQDDRSSVSDFSHMTSGAISPSDLPDSPPCYPSKSTEVQKKAFKNLSNENSNAADDVFLNETPLQRNSSSHPELTKARSQIYTTVSQANQFMYNSYATTDMDNFDQPIDYSRKYHEYGLDECNQQLGFNNLRRTNLHPKDMPKLSCSYEDTVKVFCTEDTPLNFSSASSLTDLRGVGLSGLQTPNSCFEESLEKNLEMICSLKDSSANQNENEFILKKDNELKSPVLLIQPQDQQASKVDDETSVDQTPLMFSRSSSLCSLNSFEQPLIQDDQSSVSDFSHMTSGAISPSDLPDSPPCYPSKSSDAEKKIFKKVSHKNSMTPDDVFLSENTVKHPEIATASSSSHTEELNIIHRTDVTETDEKSNRDIINKFIQLGLPKSSSNVLSPKSCTVQQNVNNVKLPVNNVKRKVLQNSPQSSKGSDVSSSPVVSSSLIVDSKVASNTQKLDVVETDEKFNRAIINQFIQLGLPKGSSNIVSPKSSKIQQNIHHVSNAKRKELQNVSQNISKSPEVQPVSKINNVNKIFLQNDPQNISKESEVSIVSLSEVDSKIINNIQKLDDVIENDERFNRAIVDRFIQLGLPESSSSTMSPKSSKNQPNVNLKNTSHVIDAPSTRYLFGTRPIRPNFE